MFSRELQTILSYATEEAMRTGHKNVRADHFMLAILRVRDSIVCRTLEGLGVDLNRFKTLLDKSLFVKEPVPFNEGDQIKPSSDAIASLHAAVYESSKARHKETAPSDLILGLVQNTMCFTWIYLKEQGIGYAELKEALKQIYSTPKKSGINKFLKTKLHSSLEEQLNKINYEISLKTNIES